MHNSHKSFPTVRRECLRSRVRSARIRFIPSWRTFAPCAGKNSVDPVRVVTYGQSTDSSEANGLNRRCVMNNTKNERTQEDSLHSRLASVSRTQEAADAGISRRGFLGFAAASILLAHTDQ